MDEYYSCPTKPAQIPYQAQNDKKTKDKRQKTEDMYNSTVAAHHALPQVLLAGSKYQSRL